MQLRSRDQSLAMESGEKTWNITQGFGGILYFLSP